MDATEYYECPICKGIVRFDILSQAMKCLSCGFVFDGAAPDGHQPDVDAPDEDEDDFECAAVSEKHQQAVDTSSGDSVEFECAAVPNYIIPFKYGKEAAIEALNRFCVNNKRLLPNNFTTRNITSVDGVLRPVLAL